MALKGQSLTVVYYAWDVAANGYKTGDASNHAIGLIKDGSELTATNAPAEVDSVNRPGAYKVTLTAAEMSCNYIEWGGKSSTGNVILLGGSVATERGVLPPSAAAGAAGGLPTVDANNAVKVQSGTAANQIDLASGLVKIQVGTGSGQLDVTSGRVKADAAYWVGTPIPAPTISGIPDVDVTYAAGQPANLTSEVDANVILWNGLPVNNLIAGDVPVVVNSPVDANVIKWLGDVPNVLILGRVDVNTQTTAPSLTFALTGNITGNVSGSVGSVTGAVGSVTGSVGSVAGDVTGSVGSIAGVTFPANFSLLSIDVSGRTDMGKWVGSAPNVLISGRVDANAQATAASLTFSLTGNITGNLSGSVGSVAGSVSGNVGGAVGSVTGSVGSVIGSVGSIAGVTFPANFSLLSVDGSGRTDLGKWVGVAPNALIDGRVDANAQAVPDSVAETIWQHGLVETYAVQGAVPTPSQFLFMLYAAVQNFDITGTSMVERKLDASTPAMTITLNDAANPTSRKRTS